jgi:2-dehydropantoate 2-reductase
MSNSVNIGIIGAGAIGCLFGGYISKIKLDDKSINVFLYTRKGIKKEICDHGLIIERNKREQKILNLHAYNSPILPNIPNLEEQYLFQYLFLTTKAYDIESAIEEYQEFIRMAKFFIILQNGIGNEEIVIKKFPNLKLLRALTNNGALMEKNGKVIHTGTGTTKIGFFKGNNSGNKKKKIAKNDKKYIEDLKIILNLAGLETIVVNDIEKYCWEKVFINIGINAFGALTNLKNGELLENEGLKMLMQRAVIEAINVAKKKGVKLEERNYVENMLDVAKKTANNKNSMLQDILVGRKKTEISFLNEKIVSYGKELGVEVTINEVVTYLIHGLEKAEN